MPDTVYKRLDSDQLLFLCNLLFQYMKGSPLNTQYTLAASSDGTAYELKASVDGGTATVVASIPAATAQTAGLLSAVLYTKLIGIDSNAEENTLEGVKVNGVLLTIDGNKYVNVVVPTKISDLTNDSDFVEDAAYVHTDNNFSNTLKTKLDGIASGAQVNVLEGVQVNGIDQTVSGKKANIAVPTKTSDLTNDSTFMTTQAVMDAIAAQLSTTYKPAGSTTFANLPSLIADRLGYVYNVTDSFTTTANFVEGAGKTYPAGTNVAIVDIGSSTYRYDVLAGFVDLSGYVQASQMAVLSNAEITTQVQAAYTAVFGA